MPNHFIDGFKIQGCKIVARIMEYIDKFSNYESCQNCEWVNRFFELLSVLNCESQDLAKICKKIPALSQILKKDNLSDNVTRSMEDVD